MQAVPFGYQEDLGKEVLITWGTEDHGKPPEKWSPQPTCGRAWRCGEIEGRTQERKEQEWMVGAAICLAWETSPNIFTLIWEKEQKVPEECGEIQQVGLGIQRREAFPGREIQGGHWVESGCDQGLSRDIIRYRWTRKCGRQGRRERIIRYNLEPTTLQTNFESLRCPMLQLQPTGKLRISIEMVQLSLGKGQRQL